MSFSITNNAQGAVITKIEALSSAYGTFTVTGGTFPLLYGQTITGTNTTINNGKSSPDGSILLFLQQGNAQVEYSINGTLYSALDYSSSMVEVKGPIVSSTDTLSFTVVGADVPVPSPTPSNTPGPTPTPTPVPVVNPTTLGAEWWIDFTNAGSLTITSGPIVSQAIDQVDGIIFSAATGGPVYLATGYNGVSGATQEGSNRLANELGNYASTTGYTWFGTIYDDNSTQTGGCIVEGYDGGFPDGTRFFYLRNNGGPAPSQWRVRVKALDNTDLDTNFDFTYSAWTALAIRVYDNGADIKVDIFENDVLLTTNTFAGYNLMTITDAEYGLMFDGGIDLNTEQFFFNKKLSNSELTQAYNYLSAKY